jgi:hypothetical protein
MYLIIALCLLSGCKNPDYDKAVPSDREPVIEPDYSGVTIPANIAPLNFELKEKARSYFVKAVPANGTELKIKSKNGIIRFPLKKWRRLMSESIDDKIRIEVTAEKSDGSMIKFAPFNLTVSDSRVDPYLCYRLLYPGYESWVEMKIIQRSTESFRESSVVENQLLNRNCINCHSFLRNEPDTFLLHVRGDMGGTYFSKNGKLRRVNLKTANMQTNAVYPTNRIGFIAPLLLVFAFAKLFTALDGIFPGFEAAARYDRLRSRRGIRVEQILCLHAGIVDIQQEIIDHRAGGSHRFGFGAIFTQQPALKRLAVQVFLIDIQGKVFSHLLVLIVTGKRAE